jgi:predicted RNase H-like nuclease (RuvC/YqgF family)
MSPLLRIALCSLTLSVCACQTTGDPERGGLFGWSEKKADVRRQDLEQANANAQGQYTTEQTRQQTLQGAQNRLAADARHLHEEVDRLMAENTDLETQLSDMLGRMKLGTIEFNRLKDLLSGNERLRQQLGSAPAGSAVPDALNTQNQKLHREILALLGR